MMAIYDIFSFTDLHLCDNNYHRTIVISILSYCESLDLHLIVQRPYQFSCLWQSNHRKNYYDHPCYHSGGQRGLGWVKEKWIEQELRLY